MKDFDVGESQIRNCYNLLCICIGLCSCFVSLFNIKPKFLFICFIINNLILSHQKLRVNKQKSSFSHFKLKVCI
jgi:hypothetical protein